MRGEATLRQAGDTAGGGGPATSIAAGATALGALTVVGALTCQSTLGVTGDANLAANVELGTNGTHNINVNGPLDCDSTVQIDGVCTLGGASGLIIPDGTAASPAIRFAGDTDAGLRYNSGPALQFSNGGNAVTVQTSATAVTGNLNANAALAVTGTLTTANARISTPPTAQAIAAATDTITVGDADYNAPISNTTGGSITLTSAPTIANGTDGEEILLYNVGTQDVVLQDQGTLANSNLRLTAATITLTPRDSVRLMFSSTVGDWLQVGAVIAVV